MRIEKITHGIQRDGENTDPEAASKRSIYAMRTESGLTLIHIHGTRADGSANDTLFGLSASGVDDLIDLLTEMKHNYSQYPYESSISVVISDGKADLVKFDPLPDYGDLMTAEEFGREYEFGTMAPDDGNGYWATETQMSNFSVFRGERPEWATHVAWFNK